MSMNFRREFQKNLRESGISSLPWGAPPPIKGKRAVDANVVRYVFRCTGLIISNQPPKIATLDTASTHNVYSKYSFKTLFMIHGSTRPVIDRKTIFLFE